MGKKNFVIDTPRGQIVTINTPSGIARAEIKWASGFAQKKSSDLSNAQEFVDSECLRYMNPLTPRLTGVLIKSGTLGTVIGSGEIEYVAPYARKQYYEHKGSGQRGPKWFERMKASHKETIRKGAAKISGGK